MDTQVLQDNNLTSSHASHVLPVELEAAIAKHDARQFRVEQREGWGNTTGGKAISKRYLNRLSSAVSEAFNAPSDNSRVDAHLLRVLSGLDPDVVALCILSGILHAIARKDDQTKLFIAVGGSLANECWGAKLTEHNPRVAQRIAKKASLRHSTVDARVKSAKAAAANMKDAFKQRDWEEEAKVWAGGWGVHVATTALPEVFTTYTTNKGKKTFVFMDITDEAWGVVDEALNAAVINNPVFFPCVVPPKPWDAWSGCGPVDARVNGIVTFLRSHHKGTAAAMRGAISSGEAQPALDGVNTLQGVAWTINTAILDVINQCAERNIAVPGLPQWVDLPIPAKLPDVVWAGMDEDRQRFVRMRKAEMHQLNRSAKCDRIQFAEDMKAANDLGAQECFWTPMSCDWRGRVYGLCHFNFQREDRVRALFQFRDGAPLGETGLYWLKAHVANCAAFDKIDKRPFDERVQWTDEYLPMIRRVAKAPVVDPEFVGPTQEGAWMFADKPFLFLASCMELTAALTTGPGYVTSLPVSFDGSCSGLQHLSAMTRAEEGALVNLTPSELPQDVYEGVAVLVKERITLDLNHQPENPADEDQVKASVRIREMAQLTLDYGVTRKLVKRNVMTYAYSSKKFGMACQLQTDLMAPLAREVLEGKHEAHPFAPFQDGDTERPSIAARYLADRIFTAIETTVQKPSEAMKFLQKLARALAHEGKPLRWTSPVGLPWINRYHDPKTKVVSMWLNSGGIRVRKQSTVAVGDEPEINKDKAANGVAPNFVHALDASHLLLTVNAAAKEGIVQIATVHDSFGCLASQATRFREIIREEFARMYETNDVLDQVLQQATCDLMENNRHMLPDAIQPGPLNLKDILNAEYAFA